MIILVFGLPGTGKSYFSRYLAADIRAKHLNTDVVRDEMNERGNYDNNTKQKIYALLLKKTEEMIKQGQDVVVDGTFQKQNQRGDFVEMAQQNEEKLYFIEMKAAEETVKERLKENRGTSEADYKVYLEIKDNFDPFSEYRLELRSDEESLDSMIDGAKKHIYEQRPSEPLTDQL